MIQNRPAFNIIRAMDIETTSGRIVITEDIRIQNYISFLTNRPTAFRQRLNSIVDAGENISRQWRPTVPNFDEISLPSYEEE